MELKRLLLWTLLLISAVACKYDDEALWDKVNSLDDRVTSLEEQLSQMNSDINSMSTIVNALENSVTVSNVTNNTDGSYEITFSDGQKITIKNGKDGTDAPIIGIDQLDGVYYWTQTVNGTKSWLTDSDGNKIPVAGAGAVTPRLKVSADGYWMVSYDNGVSYTQILDDNGRPVKAVGRDGQDGSSGSDGDSFFSDVKVENGELVLTLMDGTVVKLAYNGEIESDNPFTIIANINDPEIVQIKVDEENLVHIFGEKSSDGVAQSISTIVVDNTIDGRTTINVDNDYRPTFIETPNGIIYNLEWHTSTTGVLNAYEPTNNINLSIAFDTQKENGLAQNFAETKSTPIKANTRKGRSVLELRSIEDSGSNSILRTAMNNDQKCLVTFQKCDDYYDPNSVYLAVLSEKTGSLLSELHFYSKEGTGKYMFDIPSDVYPSIEPTVIANGINDVLKKIGDISQYLTITGGDYLLCATISVGLSLATDGAFLAAAPNFNAGCVTTIRVFAALNTINNWGIASDPTKPGYQPGTDIPGPDGVPPMSDMLLNLLQNAPFMQRIYTDNLILQPIVNGTLSGANGAEARITPDDNSVVIPVITEGNPMIFNFHLDPSSPVAGQSYMAYATLHCMPIGSIVTMHIVGTDGYVDTQVTEMTSSNAVATLGVPGAMTGIKDDVSVTVQTPDGETYTAYASLIFQ